MKQLNHPRITKVNDYYLNDAIRSPHIQTSIRSWLFTKRQPLIRQRLELEDQDFIDVDWAMCPSPKAIVVILPGLTGNSDEHYVQKVLAHFRKQQCISAVLNHRGNSGESNRLASSYHSGKTDDLCSVLAMVKARFPGTPIYGIGFSIGGNILLKYLGESQKDNLFDKCVAVSVPFKLDECADRMRQGLTQLYQRYLLGNMKRSILKKHRRGIDIANIDKIMSSETFWQIDDHYTAHVHGFDGVNDYYHHSSSHPCLKDITCPTVLLHAKDDPFVPEASVPDPNKLQSSVTLKLLPYGGHVGFWGISPSYGVKDYLAELVWQALSDHTP
jgi:uncharacterized protein